MRITTLWRASTLASLAFVMLSSAPAFAADLAALRGQWSGVWYIGMSSGKAKLVLDSSDHGHITFTNLTDEFGDNDIEISRLAFDGETLTFSVPSKGSASFAVSLKSKRDGSVLDGGGKFDGAVAKLVFNKE